MLVDQGADKEAQDKDHRIPLSRAAANGHEAAVQLLVEKGANIKARDSEYSYKLLSFFAQNSPKTVM